MPGTLLSKLFKLVTSKPAVPWAHSLPPVIAVTAHSHLVQTLGTQQRLTPPLLPLSCLALSPCASSLRGLGWVLEQQISGSSGPGQQLLGPLLAAEPHSCMWSESDLEARACGALFPSAVLLSRAPHSKPLSMWLPCTPVLSVQRSEPWPPTQISSPSNQLPLNGEVAKRGSALLRAETAAQPSGRAPPVPPQACKRRTPGLCPGNRVCCSRSASLEDLWPQIPPAPPCPCRAPCALRVSPPSPHLGHTALCHAVCLPGTTSRVQLGKADGLHPPVHAARSFPPPLSLSGHLVCLMAKVICLLQNIPAPKSVFHTPDPSNNGHCHLTTSATEGCTASLSGPFAPCPFFSWCVGYQPLNAQVTPDSPSRLASTSNQLSPGCPTSRTLPGHGTQRPPHLLALASSTWVLPLAQ